MREALPFEPPRLEEISTVTLSTHRYEQLLDAETRLDIVIDIVNNEASCCNYVSDLIKNIFIAAGRNGYLQSLLKTKGDK